MMLKIRNSEFGIRNGYKFEIRNEIKFEIRNSEFEMKLNSKLVKKYYRRGGVSPPEKIKFETRNGYKFGIRNDFKLETRNAPLRHGIILPPLSTDKALLNS